MLLLIQNQEPFAYPIIIADEVIEGGVFIMAFQITCNCGNKVTEANRQQTLNLEDFLVECPNCRLRYLVIEPVIDEDR